MTANAERVLRLRVDRNTRCEILARIMADARRAGVARRGFVSQTEMN